jgi:hypothetical protein
MIITICVVLDQSAVIFNKKRGGLHIKFTGMVDSNSQGRQKKKIHIKFMSFRQFSLKKTHSKSDQTAFKLFTDSGLQRGCKTMC